MAVPARNIIGTTNIPSLGIFTEQIDALHGQLGSADAPDMWGRGQELFKLRMERLYRFAELRVHGFVRSAAACVFALGFAILPNFASNVGLSSSAPRRRATDIKSSSFFWSDCVTVVGVDDDFFEGRAFTEVIRNSPELSRLRGHKCCLNSWPPPKQMRGLYVPSGLCPRCRKKNTDNPTFHNSADFVRPRKHLSVTGQNTVSALKDEPRDPSFLGGARRVEITNVRQLPSCRQNKRLDSTDDLRRNVFVYPYLHVASV